MTDELIKQAGESGLLSMLSSCSYEMLLSGEKTANETLARFAALVAAHEREACAKECDKRDEVYAVIFDDINNAAKVCAAAIRARGGK